MFQIVFSVLNNYQYGRCHLPEQQTLSPNYLSIIDYWGNPGFHTLLGKHFTTKLYLVPFLNLKIDLWHPQKTIIK